MKYEDVELYLTVFKNRYLELSDNSKIERILRKQEHDKENKKLEIERVYKKHEFDKENKKSILEFESCQENVCLL